MIARTGAAAGIVAVLAPVLCVAGVPAPGPIDPLRSGATISGQGAACQFRFHAGGDDFNSDALTVSVTLRDAFDFPVASCSTTVTLAPIGPDTHNFCTCCGNVQSGFTDAMGTTQFTWDRIRRSDPT